MSSKTSDLDHSERPIGEIPAARCDRPLAWISRPMYLVFIASLSGLLAGNLGRTWWVFELASHFRMIYLFALVAVAIVSFGMGRRWLSFAAGIVVGCFGWNLIQFYCPSSPHQDSSPVIRVMSANVLSTNSQYERFLNLVRREAPDIVVVLEVNASWSDHLRDLVAEYPHHKTLARPDNFGIAMYSRHPLQEISVVLLGESAVPCILTQVKVGTQQLNILAVHVLPPLSARYAANRNQSFNEIAQLVRKQSGPVVVVGDLNCTSWSPYFRDFLASADLHDSRVGFGLQPSWPVKLGPLLPIDHCLVSNNVSVRSRRLGAHIGSDHVPIVADLVLTSSFIEAQILNVDQHSKPEPQ